ncbi:MAG TPA: hypothetical protein VIG30_03670 [Ktedonobacterales bacterium]
MNGSGASRFCHLCGRALSGRFYRYAHGLVVCAACQSARPRCARCDAPLADADLGPLPNPSPVRGRGASDSHQASETPLCARCRRTAPRCACCGKPILHVEYTFEEVVAVSGKRRFCETCVKHQPRCDLCRAPVSPGASALPDGQYRCAACASEMLLDEPAVRAVYDQARGLLEQAAGITLRAAPRLAIVGRREMGEVRRRFAAELPTDPGGHHILGFFVRDHAAAKVYVEMGLPRPLLLGTLAHELAHAWQIEVAPDVSDPLLREGFAEWVAHHALVAAGFQQAAARATRRDDVYGRGLRHFLGVERRHGQRAVLARARGEHSRPLMPTAPRGG